MTYDLKLDRKHDIVTENGDFLFVGGAEQVAQQVKITLKTIQGEWFLDLNHGIPYFDKILVKNPNRAEIESILRAAVKDVPDVTAVPTMNLLINNPARKLRVEINVETDEGLETIKVDV